jgi:hypothetical protein
VWFSGRPIGSDSELADTDGLNALLRRRLCGKKTQRLDGHLSHVALRLGQFQVAQIHPAVKKLPSFRKLQQQFIWWMARYGKIWLLSDFRVLISSLLPSSEGLVDCGLRGGMAQAYRRLNDEHAKDRPPFSLATSCVEKMTGFLGTVQYLKLDRHFFRLCTSSWCSCDPSPANGN